MSETIQTAIFKLRDKIDEKDSDGNLKSRDITLEFLQKKFRLNDYRLQKLKSDFMTNHDFRLFYKRWASPVKWKEFLTVIVESDEAILKNQNSYNEGYILLIKKKDKSDIYAITGGFGHIQLQNFCNYQFGLDIISRLIKTNDKVLRAAKERNFVGGVLGSVKYFRGEYNLNENESFGSFYQELKATLNNTVLKDTFKFSEDELKSGNLCEAKSSFALKKSITLEKTLVIIEALETILKQEATVDLNLIRKLDKSENALIESLNNEIVKFLFKQYQGGESGINFEICNKDFDKFYDCRYYQISYRLNKKAEGVTIPDVSNFDIICLLIADKEKILLPRDFESFLESIMISGLDENGVVITWGGIFDHLSAEMIFQFKSYFLVNKEWYVIKPEFVKQLDQQSQDFIKENEIKDLIRGWKSNSESENVFNGNHIGDPNTLVFDKICPENIEVCDILKWDDDHVYFIHVKKGFDNEMRNLCRQVQVAARRIVQDLRSDKSFLKTHYTTLKMINASATYFINARNQLATFSEENYLDIFKTRKPVFVLAVLDDVKMIRSLSEVSRFDSNIAKFCLNELVKDMRGLGMDFKISQIQKVI